MCDVKAALRHESKTNNLQTISYYTPARIVNFICVVVAPFCACRAFGPFQKPLASDSRAGSHSSVINCLGGDFLRIWRHVGTTWGLRASFVTSQVRRFSDCRYHRLFRTTMAVDRVVGAVMLHRTLKVCWHHTNRYGRIVGVADACHVHGARRMQSRQHSILLDGTTSACIRTQRVLDADLLLDDALLDEVLVDRVAEGNDTIGQAVWVVLRLQLHLLLLMHLDGMQTILVEVGRFVRQLCLQLLLLQLLLLILILFDRWELWR